jgi:hypothetical protein
MAQLAMIGGTALQAYGEHQAGDMEHDAANYNALVKEREAQAIEAKSKIESQRQAEDASRRQSSLQLDSGAVGTTGAPLARLGEQAKQDDLENLMIGYNYSIDAQRARNEAAQLKYSGDVARYSSRIKMTSTLLKGFGSTMSMGGGNK